ncbi:MAG: hypothetical protein KF912_10240 [Phycisphaeraceae bacterium]|nr:hypothetical protein [Phycisphaeraceae bacterium]
MRHNARTLFRAAALISIGTSCTIAEAQFNYIDSGNPNGIPDLTQGNAPICAAAAMSNAFWEWSHHAPFTSRTRPIFAHTDATNSAINWGSDSALHVGAMANRIFGPADAMGARTGGAGTAAGAVRFAADNGQAYNRVRHPQGLSIEAVFGRENITYSQLNTIVQDGAMNAVLGFKWFTAADAAIQRPAARGGGDVYHAVTLAGMDPTNQRIAFSNPWGDHATPGDVNPPVSTAYYEHHTLDPARIKATDSVVIDRSGAGNLALVSSFDTPTQTAATFRPVALWKVKQGGSPNVVGSVTNDAGLQRIRYEIQNPDSTEPIHHAYILMDPTVIDVIGAYTAAQNWLLSNPSDWSVTLIDPNSGPGAELFSITNASDPENNPDSDMLVGWQSGAAGLMFSSLSGLAISETVTLGFDLVGNTPQSLWNDVYAVSNLTNTHAWFGVTIPAPATLTLLGLAVAARRRRLN